VSLDDICNPCVAQLVRPAVTKVPSLCEYFATSVPIGRLVHAVTVSGAMRRCMDLPGDMAGTLALYAQSNEETNESAMNAAVWQSAGLRMGAVHPSAPQHWGAASVLGAVCRLGSPKVVAAVLCACRSQDASSL
jgi:hypothetical protein